MPLPSVTFNQLSSSYTVGDELITSHQDRSLKGEDFMQLLVCQLKNQNPLEPMGSAEMMGQINSLTSARLSESLDLFTKAQNSHLGESYLGKEVIVQSIDDRGQSQTVQGVVDAVQNIGEANCTISINGKSFQASDVISVLSSHNSSPSNFTDYLGKMVVGRLQDSTPFSGKVTAILNPNTAQCKVQIGNESYDPQFIQEIHLTNNA